MRNFYQIAATVLTIALCVGNVFLFISGIGMSEEINKYEVRTNELKRENKDLEKKLYNVESLTYAASAAASLNYTKKATPVYLNTLGIALNR